MGDINIVQQPTSDVPDTLFNSPAQPTPAQNLPAQPSTLLAQQSLVQQSSTAEQQSTGAVVSSALEEMFKQQKSMIESQAAEIALLKEQNAKLALNKTVEDDNATIEEAMADFFGYTSV